jgi:hypothetical protein
MSDLLTVEYIFFHLEPCERFKRFLRERNIEVVDEVADETDIEGRVIHIADNLDDALSDEVEEFYDQMMELNELLLANDGEDDMQQVGLAVTLGDGRSVLASVNPDVLNRVLTVISHQELGELVDAISDAVENPDDRPLCKR